VIDFFTDWFLYWVIDWLIHSFIHLFIDRLIDWSPSRNSMIFKYDIVIIEFECSSSLSRMSNDWHASSLITNIRIMKDDHLQQLWEATKQMNVFTSNWFLTLLYHCVGCDYPKSIVSWSYMWMILNRLTRFIRCPSVIFMHLDCRKGYYFSILGIWKVHMTMLCIETCLFSDLETFHLFDFFDFFDSFDFQTHRIHETISSSIPVSLM
jgi:hypothetical protein